MVISANEAIPDPDSWADENVRKAARRALEYMGLEPGVPIQDVEVNRVFIGSWTNSRIEDLRAAARIAKGRKVSPHVQAMVVPGSQAIKRQAEAEGLDEIFKAAGFDWRESGCSMCLGMNPDILQPGERCASTSNRNFEGRQGRGGRTHLVSPAMAAAAAIAGHFVDIGGWEYRWGRGLSLPASPDFNPGRDEPCPYNYASISHSHRTRRVARSTKRRYGSDYSEAVSEASRAHRLRAVSFLRLAICRGRIA